MTLNRRSFVAAGIAAAAPLGAAAQGTAAFAARPIRIVVPFPAAGAADFLGRAVSDAMARSLGTTITIENRPGAGGNIGTAAALQGDRDGRTLLLTGVPYAVNRYLFKTLPFDPDRDFVPVGLIAVVPNLMIVPAQSPFNTVAEFVAHAKSRPGAVNYASIGSGTSLHLAGAQFNLAAGVEMVHVPYKETGTANADLMAGRVDVMFQTISAAAGLAKGGKVKALAVTSDRRAGAFPDVPTLQEAGVNLVSVGWFGLMAPSSVTPATLAALEAATIAAVNDSAIAKRIADSGSLARPMKSAEFGRFIAGETQRLGQVVKAAGIEAA